MNKKKKRKKTTKNLVVEGIMSTRKKAWKPNVENLNVQIIDSDNFVQLNKYYILYSNMDKLQLENVVVRNIILRRKIFEDIQKNTPQDLYNRLLDRRRRVVDEDKRIRENIIKKFYEINNDEDMRRIMKGIEPLLRDKIRVVILMGGNNEEVNKETQESIVKFMTFVPSVAEKSMKLGGVIPITVEHSTLKKKKMDVKDTKMPDISLQISIGTKTMQVDNTQITVDVKEIPFKDYETNIVGNITRYSSTDEEEYVEEERRTIK